MSFASIQHGVLDTLSSSVRVSGSPMLDMMLATLLSGLLLQHLPVIVNKLHAGLLSLLHRLFSALSFSPSAYRHCVEITSASRARQGGQDEGGDFGSQLHSPDVQTPDNLPVIMGALHFFQLHRVHFRQPGHALGHLQPAKLRPTTREQLRDAVLSFIPEEPLLHQGMRFTFRASKAAPAADAQAEANDEDGSGSSRERRRGNAPVSSMTMKVEGNDLSLMQDFLTARLQDEVELAYPAPNDDDRSFMFEVKEDSASHGHNALHFLRSPFATTKTFRTVFFEQKEALIEAIRQFESKTGPWAPERERAHKLVILLEGLPGTGKSSSIKAIANMTRRHLVCLNAASIADDAMLARVFRDETLTFMSGGAWRNEVVPHSKRLIVFEDLDCSGNCDWLLDRETKAARKAQTAESDSETSIVLLSAEGPNTKRGNKRGGALSAIRGSESSWRTGPTLGGLLNTLDGVCELNGHIVILTTNRANIFDPALLRPGRVDLRLSMAYMRAQDLIAMVQCAYASELSGEEAARLTAACSAAQWTASDVQELMQGAKSASEAVERIEQACKHRAAGVQPVAQQPATATAACTEGAAEEQPVQRNAEHVRPFVPAHVNLFRSSSDETSCSAAALLQLQQLVATRGRGRGRRARGGFAGGA